MKDLFFAIDCIPLTKPAFMTAVVGVGSSPASSPVNSADFVASPITTLWFKKPTNNKNVRCTMDVKRCPDGSYVGRVAPSCSFAPCP